MEFTRRHTGNITESLHDIRQIIGDLIAKRDSRKDAFAEVVRIAAESVVATDREEATKFLVKHGISRSMVKKAVETIAAQGASFTLWSLVDVLTQLTGSTRFAGNRTEADQKVSSLLALAV